MTQLIEKIRQLAGDDASIAFKPMVDTGELVDVAVAQRAGLGFIGKNGLLITKEFGSWVYLGEIITNIDFPPDTPIPCQCGECTRCIDFCPPSALLGDGHLNAQRCLSFQTQTKGMMPAEFRPMIRNVIYGCDICQLVCPFNKGKDTHFHPDMEPDPEAVSPELVPLLDISNKQFKEKFRCAGGRVAGQETAAAQRHHCFGQYARSQRGAEAAGSDRQGSAPRDPGHGGLGGGSLIKKSER